MDTAISSLNLNQAGQSWSVGSVQGSQAIGGRDSDGDGDGSGSHQVGSQGAVGQMAGMIMQTLMQMGVGTTAGTTSAAQTSGTAVDSASSASGALRSFMRDLFQALQANSASGLSTNGAAGGTDSDGDNDGSKTGAVQGQGYSAEGPSRFQQDLQSLISSLSGTAQNSVAQDGSSVATSQLSTDFQNLLSSVGAQGNGTTLSSFLQALQQQVANQEQQGKLLSAKA